MYYVGEWPREIIICLLKVLKSNFGDVDELILKDVLKPSERFFQILGNEKSDLDEVAEVMF
jgi:hypothetical protein